ncbi:uncharacterized protein LTR77_005800 [Saxophila tyrrhenica]|uniref:2EXR domain-containing protein n=1 Tax=Saxophila tyrrhenica TaxID=1690608 RepID=A0AAV9PCL8_9PEZI|nr:hypothetical protein LTR77_005800 [Saxophila tyrrhenica]
MALVRKRKAEAVHDPEDKTIGDHVASRHKHKREKYTGNLFEKLPGELRNRIWMFSLVDECPLVVKALRRKTTPKSWRRIKFRGPSLFLANKQIRQEAPSIYY